MPVSSYRGTVDDPRQNQHRLWGTLKIEEEPKLLHIFIKFHRETHFVSQGTVVKVTMLDNLARKNAGRILRANGAPQLIIENIETIIREIYAYNVLKRRVRYYVIEAIDYSATSPLTRTLNTVTEGCFNSEDWLFTAGEIGQRLIRIARELPRLPYKRKQGRSAQKALPKSSK